MSVFIPKAIYYEEAIRQYPLGNQLLENYKDVPSFVIENHNNIEEMRSKPNSEFGRMKHNLIIGVRKVLKHVPNNKTSDFLVPYTSSGCSAMCLYCYLVCNYNKCSYMRLFVNREKMLEKLIKTAEGAVHDLTFEIGSNSDLILENMITGNLEWTINEFSHCQKGLITLPTKFHQVDNLLNLNHRKKTIIRMSLNPEKIIKEIEIGTSRLKDRIKAINRLCDADYRTGILIAPVVLIEDWKSHYIELFETMEAELSDKVKREVVFEVIFMTYSYVHRKINAEAFPKSPELFDQDLMTGRGMGKYVYRQTYKDEAKDYIILLFKKYFPSSKIEYIT